MPSVVIVAVVFLMSVWICLDLCIHFLHVLGNRREIGGSVYSFSSCYMGKLGRVCGQ